MSDVMGHIRITNVYIRPACDLYHGCD